MGHYLIDRAILPSGSDALLEVVPGSPDWRHAELWPDVESIKFPSTSHISIVDSFGNALSMTATIQNGFGSRLMTNGFRFRNKLMDFSFRSHREGAPIVNQVEPGKLLRSSMSPTIVRRDGAPVLVIGSPRGSRNIGYVAQAIIAHIDLGIYAQQPVAMPHGVNDSEPSIWRKRLASRRWPLSLNCSATG